MKFRPRFSLRTLFVLTAIVAIASWTYWDGWPMWVLWREQMAFEDSARQIKAGMTRKQWQKFVRWNNSRHPAWHRYDAQHVRIGLTWIVWPNAVYCIYYRMPVIPDVSSADYYATCSSVEVFRIPPVPKDYQSHSVATSDYRALRSEDTSLGCYVGDFLDYICGERKEHPVFKWKLIYADPPSSGE